jgi:hypothetical protein
MQLFYTSNVFIVKRYKKNISITPTAYSVIQSWLFHFVMQTPYPGSMLVFHLYFSGRTSVAKWEEPSGCPLLFSGRLSDLRTQINKHSSPLSIFLLSS